MNGSQRIAPRVLVATVTAYRSRTLEDLGKSVADDVSTAFSLVRSVIVKSEPQFIRQLVSHVATANEADAIVLVGGTGFGPFDNTCEAIDGFVERRIEGFAEDYRRLLRDEFDAGRGALLARATAGVYNQCVVFALSGQPAYVRGAIRALVVPILSDAVEFATGRKRTHVAHAGLDSFRPHQT
jgi:molybdenum cofactor biosynthesis protein B